MYPEPAAADPADVARKLAAAPDLKMPNLEYVLDSDNRVVEMKLEGMTFLRDSALEKVFLGVTTLREINKVTFVD